MADCLSGSEEEMKTKITIEHYGEKVTLENEHETTHDVLQDCIRAMLASGWQIQNIRESVMDLAMEYDAEVKS